MPSVFPVQILMTEQVVSIPLPAIYLLYSIWKKSLWMVGYTGENFAVSVRDLCGAEVEVVKRSGMHKFEVLPKRWIVERSFAWVDKYRKLWKNCERKLYTTFQMVTLYFISLFIRRF